MRKKLLKVIAISSLMLTAGGVMAISHVNNTIISAKADGGAAKISEDGFTKTIDVRKTTVTLEKESYYYDATDKLYYNALGSSWEANNKFQKLDLYIEVPSAASGTLTITCAGSNTGRWMYFTSDIKGTPVTSKKFAYAGSGKKVANTFDSSNIVSADINGTTRYFIGLTADGNDYKANEITVALDKEGAVENFNGPLLQYFTVSYFDKKDDGSLEEYTSIKVNKILEGTTTTKPTFVPEKVGYTFKDWVNEAGVVYDFSTPVTSNLSLYASWTEISTFSVTFDYGYGEPKVVEVNPNHSVDEPAMPVNPDGSVFVEWQLNGTKYEFNTPVTGNITLVAKWNAPVYSELVTIDQSDINWEKANLEVTKELTATVDDKGGTVNTHPEVTWVSSNTDVVAIASTGDKSCTIKTVGNKGEATITAKIYEGTSNEKLSSIVVKVGYSKLDTDLSENLYFDCAAESVANYPGTGKESDIVDLNGQTFGGFTIHSMSTADNDTKWSGELNADTKNTKGRSLMTNADISFVAKKKGTLTFEFTTTKDTRTVKFNGVTYKYDEKDKYKTVVVENVEPGEHTLELGLSQNNSDNKIWFKYLKFEETKNTAWVDTDVHLGYQVGKMNAESTANDSVKFVGFIAKEALDYLKHSWFEITINDGAAKATDVKTTVYSSIGYYDAAGTLQEFTPAEGATTDYYYFAVTITNIPSTFKGTISAKAFVKDSAGATYVSEAPAVVEF